MAIHLRSEHAAMSEINVTPLVDVMLVLLIIFIVTAPLLMQAVPVELPKTAATQPVAPLRNLPVAVNKDGQVFLERRVIAVDKLEEELRRLKGGGEELNVLIQADRAVAFGTVAQVMAAVQRAGITRVGVVTVAE
jgi:biopolymer transport protein ExbD/biopolymer transport protein TolR